MDVEVDLTSSPEIPFVLLSVTSARSVNGLPQPSVRVKSILKSCQALGLGGEIEKVKNDKE